jgi:hypothetical protein
MLELADIVGRYGPDYLARYQGRMLLPIAAPWPISPPVAPPSWEAHVYFCPLPKAPV